MTTVVIGFWLLCSLFVLFEKKVLRMILWMFLSSVIASMAFLLLGSPDVAMAEAAASAFVTVIFVVCYEKFFDIRDFDIRDIRSYIEDEKKIANENKFRRYGLPAFLVLGLLGLFLYFAPDMEPNNYVKYLYIFRAIADVGGENVVGAIYLGYRVYDTIFEALLLVVAVVAVIHMSHFEGTQRKEGLHSDVERDGMALFLVRIVAPLTILFGIYLSANGFITAGGGFQGGLAIASFFICRFLIYDIYDIPIKKINKLEDLVFIGIVLMAALMVFQGFFYYIPEEHLPLIQNLYLFSMNMLIGLKVACGFTILFYRYVAIERN